MALSRSNIPFQGSKLLTILLLVILFCTSVMLISLGFVTEYTNNIPSQALFWVGLWLFLAIGFSIKSIQTFEPFYLLSLFALIVAWRITGIYALSLFNYLLLFGFLTSLANGIYCIYHNRKHTKNPLSPSEWQIILFRVYIGFDFIPHFTEKLFAGNLPHQIDVNAFVHLGVPDANFFVWFAGLCEFGAAIAIGLGCLLRIGAIGAALYLLIATYLGHHFQLGFIWADPGGGWEFSIMWTTLILSFAITGAHRFSLDSYFENHWKLPRWLKLLL